MIKSTVGHVEIRKMDSDKFVDSEDQLAIEEPLEIQLSYHAEGERIIKNISVTMRTPGNDEELAVGFLFTEGIIQNSNQVEAIKTDPFQENTLLVSLFDDVEPVLQKTERNFYTTSSCGVCGKSSIDAIRTVSVFRNEEDEICLPAELFYGLPDKIKKQQHLFESTGGLHAATLFDLDGNFVRLREDVGRHNALDKLIGEALLGYRLPLHTSILLLSGRASFELVQKSIMAGIKIIAAVGAPSSLAVHLAKEAGITLIGFLRKERFNIYSAWQRVRL
ncbi:MAG: formate dehydrogenase accessory sulfurtransferase FdhD [Chitinophagaceae bacterium]